MSIGVKQCTILLVMKSVKTIKILTAKSNGWNRFVELHADALIPIMVKIMILVTAEWGVAIFVCYKVSLAPVPVSRWLTIVDVLKIRCRKLLFKWSPQNNRGDLLMLLSCARGHQTWHDGGLWSQEPPSLMRTMADLKWQHSPTCWTSWRHLFPSCGQLIQVIVELLAVTKL